MESLLNMVFPALRAEAMEHILPSLGVEPIAWHLYGIGCTLTYHTWSTRSPPAPEHTFSIRTIRGDFIGPAHESSFFWDEYDSNKRKNFSCGSMTSSGR